MRKQILHKLIDLYEINDGKANLSEIILSPQTMPVYFEESNFRFRTQFNKEAKLLETNKDIKLIWQKPYQLQKIEKLKLNEEHIAKIYRELYRIPKIKNEALLMQTLYPFTSESSRIGFMATDLMLKVSQGKQLFQALRVANTQEIFDAFITMKALIENKTVTSKEKFSYELFEEEHRFAEIEYIIKPLFMHYGVIHLSEDTDYLTQFHIKTIDRYIHLKGCGCFIIENMTIDLEKWPTDFVMNTRSLERVNWQNSTVKRIVVATTFSSFLDYEFNDDLVLYGPELIMSPQWIQLHFPMFVDNHIPLIRVGSESDRS
ncbi:MAG: hypothetical protein ACRCST_14300 [Turicibacter sp.]